MQKRDKIKLLIVDDSFLIRKIIIEFLKDASNIDIIGEAIDGFEAVEKIKRLRPDVVTMDYNMPRLNGLEAIKKIKNEVDYFPAIIMVSANTVKDADETLECLKHGAIDFVTKPSGEVSLDLKKIQTEIISKILIAGNAKVETGIRNTEQPKKEKKHNAYSVVVIGASTGGPPVVEEIISSVPAGTNSTFLVVQHMPEHFTASLARRLAGISEIKVKEATEGDIFLPGVCLIAPGGKHMIAKVKASGQIGVHLSNRPLRNGFRPSIDYTMESVAQIFGAKTIGIILTGMGRDGTDGIVEINSQGGYTIVQSREDSVVDSMPMSAFETGKVDEALSRKEIIQRILKYCK